MATGNEAIRVMPWGQSAAVTSAEGARRTSRPLSSVARYATIHWSGVHVMYRKHASAWTAMSTRAMERHGPREYLRTSNLTHAFSLRQPGPAKGPSKGRENRRGSGPVSGPVSGRSGRVLRG